MHCNVGLSCLNKCQMSKCSNTSSTNQNELFWLFARTQTVSICSFSAFWAPFSPRSFSQNIVPFWQFPHILFAHMLSFPKTDLFVPIRDEHLRKEKCSVSSSIRVFLRVCYDVRIDGGSLKSANTVLEQRKPCCFSKFWSHASTSIWRHILLSIFSPRNLKLQNIIGLFNERLLKIVLLFEIARWVPFGFFAKFVCFWKLQNHDSYEDCFKLLWAYCSFRVKTHLPSLASSPTTQFFGPLAPEALWVRAPPNEIMSIFSSSNIPFSVPNTNHSCQLVVCMCASSSAPLLSAESPLSPIIGATKGEDEEEEERLQTTICLVSPSLFPLHFLIMCCFTSVLPSPHNLPVSLPRSARTMTWHPLFTTTCISSFRVCFQKVDFTCLSQPSSENRLWTSGKNGVWGNKWGNNHKSFIKSWVATVTQWNTAVT